MSTKMHAVMKTESAPGLTWSETEIPTIGPNDVLVKIRAVSICGTDLHIRRWDTWASQRVRPPLIVGHEMCGEIVEVGAQVTTVRTGDFISAESHIVCGTCDQCRLATATFAKTRASWG
jgi:threonine 3-dehydrogenase